MLRAAAFVSYALPTHSFFDRRSFRCRPRTRPARHPPPWSASAAGAGASPWNRARKERQNDADAKGDPDNFPSSSTSADTDTDSEIDPLLSSSSPTNPAALQVPDGSWSDDRNTSVSKPRKSLPRRLVSTKFVVPAKRSMWSNLGEILLLGTLFIAWYGANAVFNVYNKRVLAVFPYPLTCTIAQFAIGAAVMGGLWLTRLKKAPPFTRKLLYAVVPLSICHAAGFLLTNMALGKVSVAFTHTVKATEPFFAAALTPVMLGDIPTWGVIASLLPIVGGVGLASVAEASFNWIGFLCAVGSNIALQSRNILSKKLMTEKNKGKKTNDARNVPVDYETERALESLDNINLFATMTVVALIVLLPVSLLWEGIPLFTSAAATAVTGMRVEKLWYMLSVGGACRCLDVLTSYMILQRVSPVTHSIGNCVKRAVVISVSIVLFKTPMTILTAIGTCVALAGVLCYSVVVAGCKHNTFGVNSAMCRPIYKKELELTGGGGI